VKFGIGYEEVVQCDCDVSVSNTRKTAALRHPSHGGDVMSIASITTRTGGSDDALEDSVRALCEAGWASAEADLKRAAAAFDRTADILWKHWDDLQPGTRDRLLESCQELARDLRRIATLEFVRSDEVDLDEVLAARIGSF
jgi:acyl-CoA reductase-like NAD-dependent aldehyde dehydrogenase